MEDENGLVEKKRWLFWDWFPARYFLTMMIFLGLFVVFCIRLGMSIALVAMVNSTVNKHHYKCPDPNWGDNDTYVFESKGEFKWNPYWQGLILSSFYYGYILTQLPGGWLSDNYGSKWVFGGGVLSSSVLSLFIPVAARTDISALMFVRFMQGAGEGVMYPSVFIMYVSWSTKEERSLLLAIAFMGANVGSTVATPISAYLCENGFDGGWPSVFYTFGIIGCVWFVAWSFLVFDSPESNPWMTNLERVYLNENNRMNLRRMTPPIPWKAILTSMPFWALMYTRFTNFWVLFTMTSELPSYLSSVLRLNLRQNGVANAIIYCFLCLGMGVSGYFSDYFRRYNYFTLNSIRKGFETTGLLGSAVCLIFIPRAKCNIALIIALMAVAQALYGFNAGGSTPAIVDIAPEYAGVIAGLVGTIPCTAGFVGPMLTGAITEEGQTIDEWNTVFYIMAGLLISGGLCFMSFGNAKVQPWAEVRRMANVSFSSVQEASEGMAVTNNVAALPSSVSSTEDRTVESIE